MTRRNIEIQRIQSGTNYEPMPYGKYAGRPTVSIKLSASENNGIKVNSLENQFLSRNWKRKISSGFARLRIYGDDPFGEKHKDSLEYLFDVLNPRFVDMEVEDKYLDKQPSRFIHRKTDTYTFIIDITKDGTRYCEDTLRHLSNHKASQGNAQYIFKTDSVVQEDDIRNFRREYSIYDSEIWLYPKGRKVETVYENRDIVTNYAKRNKWNVSPRMDAKLKRDESD